MWRATAVSSVALAGVLVACDQPDSPTGPAKAPDVQVKTAAESGVPVVVATGLNDPRGLAFGPDGSLYVAEAGLGGTSTTVGQCFQKPFPFGPGTGGATARISRISSTGTRTTVIDGLPSSRDNPLVGGTVLGVADVAFIGNTLYALIAGGGCSHGNPGTTNGIIRVNHDGSWTQVTDHSAFLRDNQVARPDSGDIEPDGSPYGMLRHGAGFYVVEANQAQITFEALDGTIQRVSDVTAQLGNITPTAIAARGSHLLIGNLGNVPFFDGSAAVYTLSREGALARLAGGLTTVIGIDLDRRGRLYALETSVGKPIAPPFLFPFTGRVVRVEEDESLTTIADGLNLPTALAFGPDDELYVSVCGYGCPAGAGAVVRVSTGK
jgi:hypothetical protein